MNGQIDPLYGTVISGMVLIVASVLWIKWRQNYWKRKGVYQVKPDFFFGNLKDMYLRKKAFGQAFLEIYKEIKFKGGKHGGFYNFLTPTYMPVDPLIIKYIMSRDFECFMNHGVYFDEDREPLTGHLFGLEGEKWRTLRAKLTPLFTSGKMKYMYKTFLMCSNVLTELLNCKVHQTEAVNIKDMLERYTIDIIGNCAFGINCNTMMDPASEFLTYGRKIFQRDFITSVSRFATNIFPKRVCKLLGVNVINPGVSRFFMDVVKDTVNYREKHNFFRQDFMHLLLQLKNGGNGADGETMLSKNPTQKPALSLNELAAQCFIFFLAGYETSATTVTFALFELAMNPDIQDKLRSEIRTSWEIHDNSYDAIMKMVYLDQIIYETLRKYPPIPATTRICNARYKIPGSNIILEKGSIVHIPIIGIHTDPDYYPDPQRFDPERFGDAANKATRPACTWLPFGEGPRTCIGLRFAILQSKVGVATVINNFRISLSDKTQLPLEMDPYTFVNATKEKIWLNVEKI